MILKHPQNNIHPKLERLDIFQYYGNGEPMKNEFSSYRCECCNDLAGERYVVKAFYWDKYANNGQRKKHGVFEVCPQCVYDWQ